MPWHTEDLMTLRAEFVVQANLGHLSMNALCKQYGICRATGYKWLGRFNKQRTLESLQSLSRRPKTTLNRISDKVESACVELRMGYPMWGAKKLRVIFTEQYPDLKAPSVRTFNRVIARNGLLSETSPKGEAFKRFEYPAANDLWQMDYKGEFLIGARQYCYPLTVLDDHSRFNLVLDAHSSVKGENVKESLTRVFRQYGLPSRMLMDNGSPWHAHVAEGGLRHNLSRLSFWLMNLDIQIIFSSPYHPQTLGKDERFHRTLKYDLIERSSFSSFEDAQVSFDAFRQEYNYIRPHESLDLKRPYERYAPSHHRFPEKIKPPEYAQDSIIKKVQQGGCIRYKGHKLRVHKALEKEDVKLVEVEVGKVQIYYRNTLIKQHDLKD